MVGGLFRGGFARLPEREQARERRSAEKDAPLTADWIARRRELRLALPRHHAEVAEAVALQSPSSTEVLLLEGLTQVSIRSCLRALTPQAIAALRFEGLELLIRPERLAAVRASLRELVLVLLHEAERLPSLFDVFKLLSDELHGQAEQWAAAGWVASAHEKLSGDKLADAIKECLRVPLAVTYGRGPGGELGRQLRFLPLPGPGAAMLEATALFDVDVLLESGGGGGGGGGETFTALEPAAAQKVLPFWDARSRREPGPLPMASPGTEAQALVSALLGPGARLRRQPALELLRAWFAAAGPKATLEQRLRAAGAPPAREEPTLHAFAWCCRIERAAPLLHPGAPNELLAHAVQQASAWLGGFETRPSQTGDELSVLCFQRPEQWMLASALLAAARFGREVAADALASGVVVHAAVSFGEGAPFTDLGGEPIVATKAAARARSVLSGVPVSAAGREGAACVAFDLPGLTALQSETLHLWMGGWESQRTPDGVLLFWESAGR